MALLMAFTAWAGNDIKLGQNYPNPAKEKTYIQVEFTGPQASLKVYNVLGKLVMQQKIANSGTFMINVTDFAEGVYIYTLESNGEKITKRMTVKK